MTASRISIILAATLAACFLPVGTRAASIPAQASSIDQADLMNKAAVIEDLTYFRDVWAPRERALTPEARARFVSFINDEIASARPMRRADLALVFARGQAFTGNGHSGSNYAEGLFHPLPVNFWIFSDGAFVTGTARDHRDLLGARIKSIGGVPFADAAKRIAQFIAGNSQHKRYLTPGLLTQIEPLEAAGLAKNGKAVFEFALPSRRTRRVMLAPATGTVAQGEQGPWVAALAPPPGKDGWAHMIDAARERPLYLSAPDALTMSMVGDGSIAYIRSTDLSRASVVLPKAYVIMDGMVKPGHRPHDAIVDLRFNGGGNFFNIIDFAAELAALIPPDGHIYVITGRATFSAAIVFEALLKGNAKGRTVIVGEPVGDNPQWWSEGNALTAPSSKLPLDYTTGYHDWENGCKDLDRCYWPVVFHGVVPGPLNPDIPVDMTFAQYAKGSDPALEAALSEIAVQRRSGDTR
ncbi:hypothetical protein U1872_21835 [Sphingomonas sp. RB3P16]|uniref:hypothetical protein n=1 Tax=Parasphingomonas frigoris TaxID=3096163 RepID=UPI002FC9AF92